MCIIISKIPLLISSLMLGKHKDFDRKVVLMVAGSIKQCTNTVRLLAYVFTVGDFQSELLKPEVSNRVYWFETRISSLDSFKVK